MTSRHYRPAIFLGILLSGAHWLPGQEVDATVTGQVTTHRGESLGNAQVSIRNTITGITRETQSDPGGVYVVRFLQAGIYDILVMVEGRQEGVLNSFLLRAGQTLRLDFRLHPLLGVEKQVSPTYTWMQTESVAVRRLVERRNIRDLPLNGRNFVQLTQLLPGVVAGTPGSLATRQGRASLAEASPETGVTVIGANGARDSANRYFLDGVEFLDLQSNSYPFAPSIDALTEVKVETSTYSSLYGAAPGAQVDLITQSGGAKYHGAAWLFNRNDFFSQARDVVAGETLAPPRLNRNQYGFNLGGPTTVPRVISPESTSFFFLNYEGGRLREGLVSEPLRVPPVAMRTGDFRGLTNARTGEPILLRDPLGVGIQGNVAPNAALSEPAAVFLGYVPGPNAEEGPFNFRTPDRKARARQEQAIARLDQNLAADNLLTGRFAFNETSEKGAPLWGKDERFNLARAQNLLGQYTRSISATRVNQFRLGWNRLADRESFGSSGEPDLDVAGKMGLTHAANRPLDYGPPNIRIDGPDGVFDVFALPRPGGPRERVNNTWQISNTMAWQQGNHTLRFGGDWLNKRYTLRQARDPRGTLVFDGSYTGSALADFLLGYVRSAEIAPTPTVVRLGTNWGSLFVDDDWRVRPNLSISLGMRYDQIPNFSARDGRMVNIEQSGFALTGLVTPQTSRFGRRMTMASPTNLGPRFGIAWSPARLPNTVVRAGYGWYFTPNLPGAAFRMGEAEQETRAAAVQGSLTGEPDTFLANPFAAVPADSGFNLAISVDPYLRESYIQHWNLSLQRRVPLGFRLDASYAGSKGTRLMTTIDDLNRPVEVVDPRETGLAPLNERRRFPAFARPVAGEKSIGNSIYHSLQTSASRSSQYGLEMVLAYTLSSCYSGPTDSGGQVEGGAYAGRIQDLYNLRADRSLCAFDVRHRFTGSVIYETNIRGVPLLKWLFDGWRIAAIPTLSSGMPAPVFFNVDTTGTGFPSRPDQLAGQSGMLPAGDRTWERWFNVDAFAATGFARFGTSPRTGAVRLPGVINMDMSFARAFNLRDDRKVEFRAEVFNVANHFNPPPGSLDLNLQSQGFGSIGGGVQGVTTRVIQLAVKIQF
ncbi:MAG TPA: carboxypeptidase regulatory-like domain-containing protein [Bryobacteraceae bacterium]|nr:TonB-dependent receptor [Bryobacterales bacterium]HRJ19062.1 carboxypeptidase regulatory-like domain-containing protein [Bryobacteraceae bacterium]